MCAALALPTELSLLQPTSFVTLTLLILSPMPLRWVCVNKWLCGEWFLVRFKPHTSIDVNKVCFGAAVPHTKLLLACKNRELL